MILAYAGVKYDDERVSGDAWAEAKTRSPMGGAPFITLENGKAYGQSLAMARYLGNVHGLGGKNAEENLLIDMVVETLNIDLLMAFMKQRGVTDEEKKAEIVKDANEKGAQWMDKLNKCVQGTDTFLGKPQTSIFEIFNAFDA